MYKISLPDLDSKEVFLKCSQAVRDDAQKAYLESIQSQVSEQNLRYFNLAVGAQLYTIPENEILLGIETVEPIQSLYSDHFSKKESIGRGFYDRIILGATNSICPNCNQRQVTTLDHYLPKKKFGVFAISPVNLIPCCGDCNKAKLSHSPRFIGKQTIHPYFDDFMDSQWLKCNLVIGSTLGFKYFVEPPIYWSNEKKERAAYHFDRFQLGSFYSSQAGSEFSQIRSFLTNLYTIAGLTSLMKHIDNQIRSRMEVALNSWQVGMYQALGSCTDFSILEPPNQTPHAL